MDGGADGVTRAGADDGTDPSSLPFRLARDLPGVRIGRPPWGPLPELPPSAGTIAPGDPAVRFGTTRMIVFDPEGHATPGSLLVTDGRHGLCAVVLNGATARTRVFCFNRAKGAWRRVP